jgi:hypothetical protein
MRDQELKESFLQVCNLLEDADLARLTVTAPRLTFAVGKYVKAARRLVLVPVSCPGERGPCIGGRKQGPSLASGIRASGGGGIGKPLSASSWCVCDRWQGYAWKTMGVQDLTPRMLETEGVKWPHGGCRP